MPTRPEARTGRFPELSWQSAPSLLQRLPSQHQANNFVQVSRRLRPRQALFRAGQAFSTIYIVRSGYLKIVRQTERVERIICFSMQDDWIGLEGLGTGYHQCDAIALTQADLFALPFNALLDLAHQNTPFYFTLLRAMSLSQHNHDTGADLMAINGAEQRVGYFLLMQAKSHLQRGLCAGALNLPMSRKEIGAFLGLSLETVSRALSSLAYAGIIRVQRRRIEIIDRQRMDDLASFRNADDTSQERSSINAQIFGAMTPRFFG